MADAAEKIRQKRRGSAIFIAVAGRRAAGGVAIVNVAPAGGCKSASFSEKPLLGRVLIRKLRGLSPGVHR